MLRIGFVCVLLALLSGCAHVKYPDDPNYEPVYPEPEANRDPDWGSIYHQGTGLSLYEDIKAHRVGDIITVYLNEETDASKKGETKLQKDSDATVNNPTIFGTGPDFGFPKQLPIPLTTTDNLNLQTNISAEREFDGKAESKQNNKLEGTITVTVTKVYSNGNLHVRGEKWVNINQGDEFIRVAGIIRPQDIQPDNTINSNRIADARISYSGRGSLYDTNAPGWLTRIVNHWLFPI